MTAERHVVVVGAGLAGLSAAVAAAEQGATVTLLERNDAPGGATRDSAGWIWRYRDLPTARTCAPHGDVAVQRAVVDRLDDDLAWLEGHGARRRATGTGRAITEGIRIDPPQALDALLRRLDDASLRARSSVLGARRATDGGIELRVREGRPGALGDAPDQWLAADAVVFAGGGYAADVARIAQEGGADDEALQSWVLRARWAGDGTSMDAAMALGALRVPSTGESLVRIVPRVPELPDPRELTRFGELHLLGSVLRTRDGRELERLPHDWSGAQCAWSFARESGWGRLELARSALRTQVHAGTVEDIVRAALVAGAESGRLDDGGLWLDVCAGVTHTLCGLRVDADGRLLHAVAGRFRRGSTPRALDRVFAAGCDAAGTGMGGTASGLAQALVLGRRAGALAATTD